MGLPRATVGALIGGGIGAAIWTLISYTANLEVGWIAWGIGLLAGVGAKLAAKDELSPKTGVLAAIVAVLSIACAKFAVVELYVRQAMAQADAEFVMTNELATSYLADEVAFEMDDAGEELAWPVDAPNDFAMAEADYPPDVWSKASDRWDSMTPPEQQAFKDERVQERDAGVNEFANSMRAEGFRESFSGMDLLFLGLAIVTAFKVGSGSAEAPTG